MTETSPPTPVPIEGLVERPWRCDVTGNPVGTDTRMIGAPPCDCQGCRAADAESRATALAAEVERLTLALKAAHEFIDDEWPRDPDKQHPNDRDSTKARNEERPKILARLAALAEGDSNE